MSKTEKNLARMRELTENILKTAVKADEYAVAKYVDNVCKQLELAGEDLTSYRLVRTVDNRDVTSMQVIYSVEKTGKANDN